ncbi:NHL repeat-containing protein [Tateyamaria sp. Alg231-49]|uniref:Vgb family protein n=1 Tax=Tateyamaria sp. Alg231-49 TaxID=1922219 RepID=UPI000D54D518|nr:NHL repeat-containing protein [Tateyamaria sp. Alg231-49]
MLLRIVFAFLLLSTSLHAQQAGPFASFVGASAPVLNDPHDLAFGPDGHLYIADKFANRVAIMDPDTLEIIGSIGDGALFGAHDVSFGPDGKMYVAATGLSAVAVFDLSGEEPTSEGMLGPFPRTEGVLAHSNGRLYVMASGSGELVSVQDEQILGVVGGMPGAHDVTEAPDGTIWVADNFQQQLIQFTPELVEIRTLRGPQYGFVGPRYLDVDQDGQLFVADQDAHRVLKIDPLSGEVLGVIGTGLPGQGPNLLDDPEGVVIRGSEYFFADSDNNRIVKYVVALN